ncbi:L-carnitine dehydrogenase [Anaeromicrobium sediminis]|uniref:L-carnitine dehydrogenase n=1 Tax=Anaeromicrobium sediminis TaxID=1478221 RepID=A0A267MHR8_9FIRM|nr:L-carnitine dehydrogenase [Anaeromicrobium sediminis]PAB59121.1 3-hydroxybutyryl-CoA dehydrogenase [Anaeromicrobium sediminis]
MFINKDQVKTVAIIGTGVIGAGWAARCLHRGIDVMASDPGANAEEALREVIANAEQALQKIVPVPEEKKGKLIFTKDIEEAVKNADYIQESVPEVESIKIPVLKEISKYAKPNAIIGTSTSGLLPTRLQSEMVNPERLVVAHPFNPVYLLPLVEVVGGEATSEEAITTVMEFYKMIGMKPLKVRVEIDGFIADRLLEALWRELLHLVNDDVATTQEIDDAIIYGAGLRWSIMGTAMTYYLAGGKNGMRHFMAQFGPALKLPWTKLEAPELTDELIDKMVDGTAEQGAGKDLREWEQLRDNCLVSIMKGLSEFDHGAGKVIKEDYAIQKERLSL